MIVNIILFLAIASSSLVILNAKSDSSSEDQRAFKHPLTDMPRSAEDIETAHYFPAYSDQKFPIGQNVISLCHLSNQGNSVYNVTAIMGSLNSPFDFRHHFQNYSYRSFGVLIKPGEEISLKYGFQLHPELEPIEYQLAITVFYDSEQQSFSTTFFNQTVELYFPSSEYDFETISSVLFSFVSVLLTIVVTTVACFPESKFSAMFFQAAASNAAGLQKATVVHHDQDDEDTWMAVQNRKAKKHAAK